MDAMMIKGKDSLGRLQRDEITMEAAVAIHARVADAMIDYASTVEGAAAFREDLANGEALYNITGDRDDHRANDEIRRLIDDGALRAARNREVENAYRATQGQPPLMTELPMTLADEAAVAAKAAAQADAKANWAADPLGLRATEAATGAEPARPDLTQPIMALDGYTLSSQSRNIPAPSEDDRYRLSAPPVAPASDRTATAWDGTLDPDTLHSQIATATGLTNGGRGFGVEMEFTPAPGTRLPQQPSAATEPWMFEGNDFGPPQVVSQNDPLGIRAEYNARFNAETARLIREDGSDRAAEWRNREHNEFHRKATAIEAAVERKRQVRSDTLAGRPSIHRDRHLLADIHREVGAGKARPPVKGLRARFDRAARTGEVVRQGTSDFGPGFASVVKKYQDRLTPEQIAHVATLVAVQSHAETTGVFNGRNAPDSIQQRQELQREVSRHTSNDVQQADHTFRQRYIDANLTAALDAITDPSFGHVQRGMIL